MISTELESQLYRKMLTIRLLEDELQKMCFEGEAGDLHFNKGQEAISVGACAALRTTDYIVTHHRTIAHSIARGLPLKPLVAEILGKSTGINGGIAGEMHINYPKLRYLFSFQLVGTCISVSAGVAWAVKNYLRGSDIVACFHGDAAAGNGQFHEGLNIASVQRVPLLLVCENNGLAGNVRPEYYQPTKTVMERCAAYGVRGAVADGNRVDEVVSAVGVAAKYVRENSLPYLLELNTTRLCWHKQGQRDIRPPEELAELSKRDPLLYEERRLGITDSAKAKMSADIVRDIKDAIEDARGAAWPNLASMSA